jgi:SpoVK/Ycf46/Vps4 family AAA+-type ATPase
MARADLVESVIRAGLNGDNNKLRKAAEAIIAEENSKQHTVFANRLGNILKTSPVDGVNNSAAQRFHADQRIDGLFYEIVPQRKFDEIVLPSGVKEICQELVQEHMRADLLRSYGLEPRNKVLLIGAPGNGKTSLAEAIAESLMVPMLVVRYESIVGSYLGETSVRLKNLIEYARTRRCVLFFDEFDTLGKERGDTHETGEIKRVVSSLLLQIDSIPSHVVVIAATNHPELLDRAVWRRFQIRAELPLPTKDGLIEWFQSFIKKSSVKFGFSAKDLAEKMLGANYAEVEEFARNVLRKVVLSGHGIDAETVVQNALNVWSKRAASVNSNRAKSSNVKTKVTKRAAVKKAKKNLSKTC